ncbi:MAG: 50S ribosomal protein L9, partial [Anaerolineales bacterium]|nr:50S ribosomal protein L9 [Anaerolineales bacterium]
MKVLLLEDVYKLGRAGDVKKVAPGYARNYLMPQGLVVLATPGAVKQAGRIRKHGEVKRAKVNKELGGVAEQLEGKLFLFAAKASETRRLYGSINTQMIAEKVSEEIGVTVEAKQIESQPLRMIGKHDVSVRLTVDLIPKIEIIVHREGESPESALEEEEKEALRVEEALVDIFEDEDIDQDVEFDEVADESEPAAEADLTEEVEEVEIEEDE